MNEAAWKCDSHTSIIALLVMVVGGGGSEVGVVHSPAKA